MKNLIMKKNMTNMHTYKNMQKLFMKERNIINVKLAEML